MSELLKITLPDGSLREVASGTTPADIAAAIGPGPVSYTHLTLPTILRV